MKREFNFENFYVYEGNKVAVLAAQKVIEFPGELFNPLYIYGCTGIGKTHLLRALHNALSEKFNIPFFSAKEFERYLSETKHFTTPLIVDDLHNISKEYHNVLLNLIDVCLAQNNQLCFSGNAAPRALKGFDTKLLSRLEGGLVCDIAPAKEMALVDLIKNKAGESGLILPDEVALEIAQISTGSIRTIEGMINRLVAYSSLANFSLEINNIRMILKEFYPKGIYSPVSSLLEELKKNASEILGDVSEKLDVKEEYQEKIYVWEMKGFDISSLKPLLDGDIEILKREYDKFIKKVERLIALQKEYGALDTSAYPDEGMKIESMLFSPDCVEQIEEIITKIKSSVPRAAGDNSFDNFIIGAGNSEAVSIYQEQIAPHLGEKFNPFIIFGGSGTGKTHLLTAIYNDLSKHSKKVYLIDCAAPDFEKSLLNWEEYDVLLFDNLHNIFTLDEAVRTSIFDIIERAQHIRKAVICCSKQLPDNVLLSEREKAILEAGVESELKLKPKKEEFITLGLPGEETRTAQESPREENLHQEQEVIELGLPGEEVKRTELDTESSEKGKTGVEVSPGKEITVPLKTVPHDRFMVEEIQSELLEDNF